MKPLTLDSMRSALIRQEETIIFALLERAQFKYNHCIYERDAISLPEYHGTFLDFLLFETEAMHAKIRRYTSAEEHAFSFGLPRPLLPVPPRNSPIVTNEINVNDEIKAIYVNNILPEICPPGDCGNYGSSATCDVTCLQGLSKRIHYGKFIAEAKFQDETERYSRLIEAQDADGIMNALVNKAVEEKLLKRVMLKTQTYGQEPGTEHPIYKIKPETVAEIYQRFIIPLTCKVEVEYLLRRLDAHTAL